MEEDFIRFKLWKQFENNAVYISISGGCLTKSHRAGLHFPTLNLSKNPHGHSTYPSYTISKKKKGIQVIYNFYPHRAVALTYLPNHDLFKTQVDHLDGNKFNNHLWNLEWVTEAENHRRAAEARRRARRAIED